MKLSPRSVNTGTRAAGRWRRVVLILGVMAVTLILWVRNQRIDSFREQVSTEVVALIDLVEQGVVPGDPDPALALVSGVASIEIGRLERPMVVGPVLVDEEDGVEASVLVTGDAGRSVRLVWQGSPPILVGVERFDAKDSFEQPMEEPRR